MSLFDGQAEIAKFKPRIKNTQKSIKGSLPKTKRPNYKESSAEDKPKITRDERRRITEAYERGELKFPDVSHEFLLCRCSDYYYPHSPHVDEIAKFELLSYARKK